MALTLTTSRSRSPRLYPVNSPKGPSAVRAPGWISASMISSACAGTRTSEVSHLTSSSGSRSSPPMMARSSSSMEPMASAPSAMAGCTPMAKPTAQGLRDALELPEVLAQRQMNRRRVAPLDHEAVVGAVPVLARRVLGEGDGRGEVRARIPFVVEDLGQIVKIDPLAGEDHVLAGPALHEARGYRLVHGA